MGKKQQTQQRSKGNLQTSSSSRAAQLLQSKNANISGLGFCKDNTADGSTASVDSVLSSAFRKLGKKEAITKQKALSEILDTISSENVDGCLPLWGRNYHKISIDNDRKIRELSQLVQEKVAGTAGRNMAPHLSPIIGPWLEGTCDIHLTTAQIASNSLSSSFSEEKLVGVIKFCEKGILKHIKERLISSPSSLSDMKITDPVEAEEKYARVIGSTLRMLISILLKTQENPSTCFLDLVHDPIVWNLGRAKILQVRKHLFNFISDLCLKFPDCVMPESAYKSLTQHLNSCNHECTVAQYSSLCLILKHKQDLFWSTISRSDVRGQLLDTVKSKAFLGGVLEPVFSLLQHVTVMVYKEFKKDDLHIKWIEDIFSNSVKCLGQCKSPADRNVVLQFLATITSVLNSTDGFQLPESLFQSVGSLTSLISVSLISPGMLDFLSIIVKYSSTTTEEHVNSHVISHVILSSIKQNEEHLSNLISTAEMLLESRPDQRTNIFASLTDHAYNSYLASNFDVVAMVLSRFEETVPRLYEKQCQGDTSDVALINLVNAEFIPKFSYPDCTPQQITRLCEIFTLYASVTKDSFPVRNLVTTLILSTAHKDQAFLAFIKLENAPNSLLSEDFVIKKFDSLEESVESVEIAKILADHGSSEVQNHVTSYIRTSLSSHDVTWKLRTVLCNFRWVLIDESTKKDLVHLILENINDAVELKSFASVLRSVVDRIGVEQIPSILSKIVTVLNSDNRKEISEIMFLIFEGNPQAFLSHTMETYKPPTCDDLPQKLVLFEKYGVLCFSEKISGSNDSRQPCPYLLECCLEFAGQSSLGLEENLAKILYTLLSQAYSISLDVASRSVLANVIGNSQLVHHIVDEFIWQNDVLVVFLLKELQGMDFHLDWSKLEGIYSLPTDTLVCISSVFESKVLLDIINNREMEDMTIPQHLSFLHHQVFKTHLDPLTKILEYLSETCLEGDLTDIKLIPGIFTAFHSIFVDTSSTDEDLEFVLCSMASVIQALFDMYSECTDKLFLTVALLTFKNLYQTVRKEIKTNDKFHKFCEDWDVFFAPGIQDIMLIFQDRLLADRLLPPLRYLSSVAMMAPTCSVKSYAKNRNFNNFEECFEHVNRVCNVGHVEYETQTALFFLLLRCQDIFGVQIDDEEEEDEEEEDIQFLAPPKIFLDALSAIDLQEVASEHEYEFKLIKCTQIWILLLRTELTLSSEIVREHVGYLRSKKLLEKFLNELAYLLDFSARKCQIVELTNISQSDRFEVQQMASTCFLGIASIFPALLRAWWKKLDKEMTISVEKFVAAFVSPILIKSEADVRNSPDDETLKIRSRPVVREVIATYVVDDISADLVINIAANHPLTPPTVSCERQVGVPIATWRSWMLQMTGMFQNQNSSIVEALEHWRKNMDKQFDGIESCMICFSVVQGPKKLLPKPCCKTCKKRFHSACLYKWFSTSGKSTCPMCRTPFQHSSGLRSRLQEVQEPE